MENLHTNRMIEIARDGRISDDEIKDFALIRSKLEDISKKNHEKKQKE